MSVFLLVALGCNSAEDAYRQMKEQAKAQTDAVTALRELGAKLEEKAYMRGHKAWTADLSGLTLSDQTFALLKRIGHITELNLSKTNLTDAQMETINDPEFSAVILTLDLSNTTITDAGLAKLTNLPALGDLKLTGTQVTTEGVDRFRQARAGRKVPLQLKELTIER
jgi:hypothetical protein